MTVEQHDVVDSVGIDTNGQILLMIFDHLPWDQVNEHLYCLQEKLNCYLRFAESGEIYDKYPKASGRRIVVNIVLKYPVPLEAAWFFKRANESPNVAGFGLMLSQVTEPTNILVGKNGGDVSTS